ncbi:MAG: ATP-binding cassette domain-containing protein, partial [Enterococcus gallinarum]|nr:ATP-binding cassette domain-containing protein [Enterococcus gallinarum]
MLELKDIKKYYKVGSSTTKALDGVSVAFRKQEFVAILGPSGSGKTTMLNVIS